MKNFSPKKVILLALLIGIITSCNHKSPVPVSKEITVDASKTLLTSEGFGVNITPNQWRNGNLKSAIDMLVNDLGATQFRFDCVGLANWLDPLRREKDGTWPSAYLDSVYRSQLFKDAWETFRYLNSKGIEPFFNVSGRIHPGLGKKDDPFRLADFEGYGEMIATMLKWAREKENLKFTKLAPFNETDLGYPEGPKIDGADMLNTIRAIVKKLDFYGLHDIKLIVMDDSHPSIEKLNYILSDSTLTERICCFGAHSYGDSDFPEMEGTSGEGTHYTQFVKLIKKSSFKNASLWLTEYGDLDQTGEIEWEFSRRSTRRLMKSLKNGFNAAMVWDAFDNFHEHDTTWATYGLLRTDTLLWKYTPKKRYFAAKQIYRFVKPGWSLVQTTTPQPVKYDVYKVWHDSFRNIKMMAFVSHDKKDYSVVIMNPVEKDVELLINLNGISGEALIKPVYHFSTSVTANCEKQKNPEIKNNIIKVILPKNCISTITTLK